MNDKLKTVLERGNFFDSNMKCVSTMM